MVKSAAIGNDFNLPIYEDSPPHFSKLPHPSGHTGAVVRHLACPDWRGGGTGKQKWVLKQIQAADKPSVPTAPPPNPCSTSDSAPAPALPIAMVNYPVNVVPYIPQGMTIELGPEDRVVPSDMVVHPVPPLNHDFLAVAEVNRHVPFHQKAALRQIITGLLHESHFFPSEIDDYPLGIAIYGFEDPLTRDNVVGTTFEIDAEVEGEMYTVVSFVPHNSALNMRLTSYGPEIWLLYIGFPHDYQTYHYTHRSVDRFGNLLHWFNPRGDRKFVLIKAKVINLRLVPKIFVMRQLGGDRFCWTICVTMLKSSDWNAHLPEVPPADEDPPLADGIPHPLYGEGLTAEQLYQMQLNNWMAQNVVGNNAAQQGEGDVVVDQDVDI